MHRVEVIHRVLAANGGDRYLEIGVSKGTTFHQVAARTKVAVDPHFRFRVPASARLRRLRGPKAPGAHYYEIPSDEFFAGHAADFGPFDAVLIDGLHTADQTYRDVVNAAAHLSPAGVIVMHDCNPQSATAAMGSQDEARTEPDFVGTWNGDVFRSVVRLRAEQPGLDTFVLACDQGLGIVRSAHGDDRPPVELGLDEAAIAGLTYDELDADRERLLDLRPPEALDDVLADIAAR